MPVCGAWIKVVPSQPGRDRVSDSSQCFASQAQVRSGCSSVHQSVMNAFCSPQGHSTIVRTMVQAQHLDAAPRRSTLPGEADGDTKGASSNLFMCSPHSCEVVKPVISRSFGHANQTSKRAAMQLWPVLSSLIGVEGRQRFARMRAIAHRPSKTCMKQTAWAALCGHGGELISWISDAARPDQETSL